MSVTLKWGHGSVKSTVERAQIRWCHARIPGHSIQSPSVRRSFGEGFQSCRSGRLGRSFRNVSVVRDWIDRIKWVLTSEKSQTVSSIRSILVPHARGIIPDGKWIWSYIRDDLARCRG